MPLHSRNLTIIILKRQTCQNMMVEDEQHRICILQIKHDCLTLDNCNVDRYHSYLRGKKILPKFNTAIILKPF